MASRPQRISLFSAIGLVLTALILDAGSFVPILNWLTSGLAVVIFGIWFYLRDVSFINPKLFGSGLAAMAIEMVPFLSWLPGLTAAVIATIVIVKSEDKLGISIPNLKLK